MCVCVSVPVCVCVSVSECVCVSVCVPVSVCVHVSVSARVHALLPERRDVFSRVNFLNQRVNMREKIDAAQVEKKDKGEQSTTKVEKEKLLAFKKSLGNGIWEQRKNDAQQGNDCVSE